ncbi:MAG TPA: UDP-N-acetylmuramoyl-L-alanyl-D-glutamate--2,6-diaminopimelate ligase [Acidimicrobiia bacterium]|nr:UDP-N-acetylmuramoyl-L-alanyl-D-glutamate--2,6-diaminopimelate ligase [Acidimicrobiia bacterium]
MASRSSSVAALAEVVGGRVLGDPTVTVRDVTHDSRQAGPGTMFAAVVGSRADGHDFVEAAVGAGSPAVLVQRECPTDATQLVVEDVREAMGPVAAEVHGHPSRRLSLVGVTGTNGKTTVTHMVEAIGIAAGRQAGLIGTVHTRVGSNSIPNTRTTPEATDFQRLLATMVRMGAEIVSAEVSSHALAMHRVEAARFAVAAFTNLSQDHLDFHGDMESYFLAKARLFEPDLSERAVVWVDDPAGERLTRSMTIPYLTVGADAEVTARNRRVGVDGSRFVLATPEGEVDVELPLGGDFNIDNALIAAGCALSLSIPLESIAAGLRDFRGVPGRFEVVSGDATVTVLVDYAHTPASIANAIASVRETGRGEWVSDGGTRRLIVVFGAGGDRDRAKRPQMGWEAMAADEVIVTSDNPRSEPPEAIIEEVVSGVDDPSRVRRLVDRREAIGAAIEMARDGDVVLILGRGHERGQEVQGRILPFDDRLVAREALIEQGRIEP